jgi:hypothetical protein
LSTDQLSKIIKEPIFARSREGGNTLSVIEKKTMLSCIVNFLYSDFTFFVLFNENMQRLLFGKTFDQYKKLGPIQNNRNNYFLLLDKNERTKEPILYKDFGELIEIKNKIKNGGEYKYLGFENTTQNDDQLQIRVGELTIYIKEFLGLLTKFQEKIANVIYANRMGNGDTASGDGYKYRGRGPIQLTGKDNYRKFATDFFEDPETVIDDPDLVTDDIPTSLYSALWFWNKNNLNKFADVGDVKGMTKVINGGYIGLEDRIKHYNHAIEVLTV